jgi:hypothetical protein
LASTSFFGGLKGAKITTTTAQDGGDQEKKKNKRKEREWKQGGADSFVVRDFF